MNVYEWSVFIAVVEQKSFVQAAGALNVSQSAVSHIISKLESECGFALLNRNRSGVTLTSNGECILPFVRQMLNCENSLQQKISKLKSKEDGIVKIGAFHTATVLWLPEIMRSFKEKHPNIELIIKQTNDKGVYDMIASEEVDLAFAAREAVPEGYSFFPLHQSELLLISCMDYVPKNNTNITVEDLKNNNIIFPVEGYTTNVMQAFYKHNLHNQCCFRIEDDDTLLALVEQGFGLSMMPEMALGCSNYRIKKWHTKNKYKRIVGLVSVFSDHTSPAANLFRQEILDFASRNSVFNL